MLFNSVNMVIVMALIYDSNDIEIGRTISWKQRDSSQIL